MALSFKMAAGSVAAVLLLLATPQARVSWALEDDEVMMPDDMVLVEKPAEQVALAIPGGGAGTIMQGPGSTICLQCHCCSRSNPGKCVITTCCSSLNCERGAKCDLKDKCGCAGCSGAD